MNRAFEKYARLVDAIKSEIGRVVIGQEALIDLMLLTLLSRGHILLEGVPGLAKSLAVEIFAAVIGGDFRRFQFTPDKMPGDITGTTVFDERKRQFGFHRGPVFCNIFLADEINRASPKVQSALLQAMQEKVVDADDFREALPELFIVLATQNPVEQVGTYPLAEAQTDRFMVKFNVAYPQQAEEAELMARKHGDFETRRAGIRRVATPEDMLAMQRVVHEKIRVTRTVMAYMLSLCLATRPPRTCGGNGTEMEIHRYIRLGASPRATESLLALSKARAFCRGRDFVRFDDVTGCAPHVLRHRILLNHAAAADGITPDRIVNDILNRVVAY
ncbi:ATPase [Desulfonema ishimotonii]|uniref:ATPase n=1 Tax=Desulfonema ishimotonii TaxID=45657 RepID=A0A401FWX3_9BACT|nr:AAA family ATPase [Desulfonema ishimotonii]GBC61478.1 ATPase [Desulfonema ishimotonii]